MTAVQYYIPSIHCAHCAHTIKLEVGELAGVSSVEVDLDAKTASIRFAPPASEKQIRALLQEIQYPVSE